MYLRCLTERKTPLIKTDVLQVSYLCNEIPDVRKKELNFDKQQTKTTNLTKNEREMEEGACTGTFIQVHQTGRFQLSYVK